jgi:hypothetical protein
VGGHPERIWSINRFFCPTWTPDMKRHRLAMFQRQISLPKKHYNIFIRHVGRQLRIVSSELEYLLSGFGRDVHRGTCSLAEP